MARQKRLHNPFDFAFGMLYNEYPKELHENLCIPGKFRRKSNVKARFQNGKRLEMDASYVVDPDFEILFEPAVVDLEHQSKPVDISKIQTIGEYNIQQIADERLPTLNIIASHLNEELSVKQFKRTPTTIVQLQFLNLGKKEIEKRLNILENIINDRKQITTKDAINLGIIVLFAPREDACEITRKALTLYLEFENRSSRLEYTLYSVFSAMIDAYFDNEHEYEELMVLINKETNDEIIGKFETEIISENKIKELEDELVKSNNERDSAYIERDSAYDKISEVNHENMKLKSRIKDLENQLKKKNRKDQALF